ncbi:MAG: tail fiber domain-containing protein [Betaproteobacteria bacterium]|nr:tail fiber domain-containing protein [Betaproteobacteria bacterium]
MVELPVCGTSKENRATEATMPCLSPEGASGHARTAVSREIAMRRALLLAAVAVVATLSGHARAQFCPGVAPYVFTDVPASDSFCGYITWMAATGVTTGCQIIDANNRLYCPDGLVTRKQMAAFMSRLGVDTVFAEGGNAFGSLQNNTAVLGTTDGNALDVRVNAVRAMRYEPNAISPNLIGGSAANSVATGVRGATIGGGGVASGEDDPDFGGEGPNLVTDHYGTVGGGYRNQAGDAAGSAGDRAFATVAGGAFNTASGTFGTVAGGDTNTASGYYGTVGGGGSNTASGGDSTVAGGTFNVASGSGSTVAGGDSNAASGTFSTVAGGNHNTATGARSFAAGARSQADQDGCFTFVNWSDDGSGSCLGTPHIARFILDHGLAVDYFSRRADGGGTRWVYVGDLSAGQTIATWTGAFLSNAGVWTNASDRSLKAGFEPIDARSVLDAVVALPIARWHYRQDGPGVEHIGPTAQDFKAAFGLGDGDKGIGTVDADGVALAAIQGLNAKLEEREATLRAEVNAKDAEIAALRSSTEALTREIAELRASHRNEMADLRVAVELLLAGTRPDAVAAKP